MPTLWPSISRRVKELRCRMMVLAAADHKDPRHVPFFSYGNRDRLTEAALPRRASPWLRLCGVPTLRYDNTNQNPVHTFGVARMSRCLLAPVFVAILALPLVGRADAPAQSKPLFDYRETTLANGLRIITLADASCPIVAVHLWYHVGSKDERPERQGFAHMFEHMMFRGTDRLGPKDHFEYIRRCGGTCNAYTNFDQTVYVQTLPSNQLELALWLEAERMGFLKIDQTSVDTERKVVEEERRLGLNRPYGTVPEKLVRELFPGQAYGWLPIGKISHLRASAAQELRDFWLRYYVPNNATLIIVGDVQHDEAQRLAKRYFGWLPGKPIHRGSPCRDPCQCRRGPSPSGKTTHQPRPWESFGEPLIAGTKIMFLWNFSVTFSAAATVAGSIAIWWPSASSR